MIKFSDLIINKPETILVLNKVIEREVYYKKEPRYVIGVDPFDFEEKGLNVFKIYDKHSICYCLRITTRKSFEETVEKMMQGFYKNDVIISKKFINKTTGKTITPTDSVVNVVEDEFSTKVFENNILIYNKQNNG